MRPVRLELDGFASFRQPTTVDFTGADFFALVGPTGAGKSTVIDAMVFALYGSAPRWDRANAVQYALAPTSTRATVRLVFDIGDQRYQVAREVRRSGKSGPQQKAASLERFDDPSQLSADTGQVTVLAAEVRELTPAIEQLLGLSFDDFTKAVVLPQGRFAEFLSATPSRRQEILLKLLGAHQYDLVMKAAGVRRTAAETQVATSQARIDDLGGATEQAEREAEQQLAELGELDQQVSDLQQHRHRAAEQLATDADAVTTARQGVAALTAVSIPTDVATLADRAQTARSLVEQTRAASVAAEQSHARARADLAEAGDPTVLQQWRQDWTEQESLTQSLPQWQTALAEQTELTEQAQQQADLADQAWQQGLTVRQGAEQRADAAQAQLVILSGTRQRLADLQAPAGTADLSQRWESAAQAESEAATTLTAAEQAEDLARAALDQAGDAGELAAEAARLQTAIELTGQLAELGSLATAEQARLGSASRAAERAEQQHREAVTAAQSARDLVLAHTLRGGLQVGHQCPVCTTTITVVPEVEPAPDADQAADAARAADHLRRTADQELAAVTAKVRAIADQVDDLQTRFTGLGLPDTDPAELLDRVSAQQTQLRAATDQANAAARARSQARSALAQAQQQVSAVQAERQAALAALRAAAADLSDLGASTPAEDSPHQGWQALLGWAGQQLATLEDEVIPAALAEHEQADTALTGANDQLDLASRGRQQASAQLQHHTQATARAQAELDRGVQRSEQLTELLSQAPPLTQVQAELDRIAELSQAERQAFTDLQQAAAQREAAVADQQELSDELALATELLRTTRAPLIGLGAPVLDESDLPGAWAALSLWAEGATGAARMALTAAEQQHETSRLAELAAGQQIVDRLTAAGLTGSADQATAVVATALARASDRTEQIRRDRERRASLIEVRDRAAAQRDVAAMLAQHLNAKNFQRWLAAAALDLLVEAASASLLELSGGQFGLTHEGGEFFVIDHAEADAQRSVKTLSGGETFQASLALALALSAELSSLSASAARLDSIFLDEGFGSLDPDSLEVVAQTLERLAQGDRMVGVITHVQQLAERIPTRFQVSRTPRGSTVTKVG